MATPLSQRNSMAGTGNYNHLSAPAIEDMLLSISNCTSASLNASCDNSMDASINSPGIQRAVASATHSGSGAGKRFLSPSPSTTVPTLPSSIGPASQVIYRSPLVRGHQAAESAALAQGSKPFESLLAELEAAAEKGRQVRAAEHRRILQEKAVQEAEQQRIRQERERQEAEQRRIREEQNKRDAEERRRREQQEAQEAQKMREIEHQKALQAEQQKAREVREQMSAVTSGGTVPGAGNMIKSCEDALNTGSQGGQVIVQILGELFKHSIPGADSSDLQVLDSPQFQASSDVLVSSSLSLCASLFGVIRGGAGNPPSLWTKLPCSGGGARPDWWANKTWLAARLLGLVVAKCCAQEESQLASQLKQHMAPCFGSSSPTVRDCVWLVALRCFSSLNRGTGTVYSAVLQVALPHMKESFGNQCIKLARSVSLCGVGRLKLVEAGQLASSRSQVSASARRWDAAVALYMGFSEPSSIDMNVLSWLQSAFPHRAKAFASLHLEDGTVQRMQIPPPSSIRSWVQDFKDAASESQMLAAVQGIASSLGVLAESQTRGQTSRLPQSFLLGLVVFHTWATFRKMLPKRAAFLLSLMQTPNLQLDLLASTVCKLSVLFASPFIPSFQQGLCTAKTSRCLTDSVRSETADVKCSLSLNQQKVKAAKGLQDLLQKAGAQTNFNPSPDGGTLDISASKEAASRVETILKCEVMSIRPLQGFQPSVLKEDSNVLGFCADEDALGTLTVGRPNKVFVKLGTLEDVQENIEAEGCETLPGKWRPNPNMQAQSAFGDLLIVEGEKQLVEWSFTLLCVMTSHASVFSNPNGMQWLGMNASGKDFCLAWIKVAAAQLESLYRAGCKTVTEASAATVLGNIEQFLKFGILIALVQADIGQALASLDLICSRSIMTIDAGAMQTMQQQLASMGRLTDLETIKIPAQVAHRIHMMRLCVSAGCRLQSSSTAVNLLRQSVKDGKALVESDI